MRFTGLEEVGPPRSLKGLKRCPKCLQKSLERKETQDNDVPATRGAVLTIRRLQCITLGCVTKILCYDVVIGESNKISDRSNARHRDAKPLRIVVVPGDGELLFKIRT